METMICNVCGCSKWEETEWKSVLGSQSNIIECKSCGLRGYDTPLRGMDNPEQFYNTKAYNEYIERHVETGSPFKDTSIPKSKYERTRRITYTRLIKLVEEVCGSLERIYEIGAAWGLFLDIAKKLGIDAAGCDLSRHAASIGNLLGHKVEHSQFVDAETCPPYDAIFSLDTIEHTPTPGDDLRRAHELVRDGGCVMIKTFYDEWHNGRDIDITTPAKKYLDSGYFGVSHLWHFSTDSLVEALFICGWKVARMRHLPACGQIEIVGVKL